MADSTVSTLFPGLPFMVGREWVYIRPVVLSEIPAVERVVEAWRLLVATGGTVLDAGAWEDFLVLLAAAAGKPMAWLEGLEESAFEQLVGLVLASNENIWKPEGDGPEDETTPWAEILQRLIESGHDFNAVLGYTMPQAKAFLLQSARREREALAQKIQASAFAMADTKSVQRVVKELRHG